MTEQDQHTFATVLYRYAELHTLADSARTALRDVLFRSFKGILSDEEIETLNKAIDTLELLRSKTTQYDAVRHFDTLTNE